MLLPLTDWQNLWYCCGNTGVESLQTLQLLLKQPDELLHKIHAGKAKKKQTKVKICCGQQSLHKFVDILIGKTTHGIYIDYHKTTKQVLCNPNIFLAADASLQGEAIDQYNLHS